MKRFINYVSLTQLVVNQLFRHGLQSRTSGLLASISQRGKVDIDELSCRKQAVGFEGRESREPKLTENYCAALMSMTG